MCLKNVILSVAWSFGWRWSSGDLVVGGVDALLVVDSDDVVSVSRLSEVVVGESMGEGV